MIVAELMVKLSALPPGWEIEVLDNHTGACLAIKDVDTAEAMDLDCADTPEDNRLVIIRAEE